MRMMVAGCLVTLGLVVTTAPAAAQNLGTYSFQTAPYCNVVSIEIVQQGPLFQLVGTDDQCGAGTAPLSGTAVVAGGNVVFGMTVSTPQGPAAHLSATVAIATVTGTWSDGDGHTGAFVFNGSTGGAPRPAPAPSTNITVTQLSPTVYAGTGAATTVARSDHDHDARYYTKAQVDAKSAEVIVTPSTPTIEATGNLISFTTTRTGNLQVRLFVFWNNVTCTAGSPSLFIRVDTALLRGSVLPNTSTYSGYMMGETTSPVAAGSHFVGYGVDCPTGPITGGTIGFGGPASVIVLP